MCVLMCGITSATAQEYNGTGGLLHVPSADTDAPGTFRGYAYFLGKQFTPTQLQQGGEKYNTFSYGVGVTVFSWLELSYQAALLKMEKYGNAGDPIGYYNEDRHVNIKLRPLKEGKWWPAIALGWDDVGRWASMKTGNNLNNYFQNLYIVGTKHFDIRGHQLGAHLAYRYYTTNRNKKHTGIAGGITYTPRIGESLQDPKAWLQRPRFIVEWDGTGVNVGADVLLWRHLFVQAAFVHGCGFTGGLGYHYTIPF